jgi:hypothetical protein
MLTRSKLWIGLCFGFVAVGFLFGEGAIVVLPLAAVIDVLYLRKKGPQNIFERVFLYYVPFLVVVALYFWYRKWMTGVYVQAHPPRTLLTNLMTESRILVRYFNLLAWPIHLNFSYDATNFTDWIKDNVMISVIYLCAWLAAGVALWRKYPIFTLFVLGFFITIAPTTLIPLNATMAEHRLYLSTLFLGLLLAQMVMNMEKNSTPIGKTAWSAFLILMFLLWGILLVDRNRVWVSDMTLLQDALTKSPTKVQVLNDLGNVYYRLTPPDINSAERFSKWAIRVNPSYNQPSLNLPIIVPHDPEAAKWYYQNAVKLFKQAAAIYPNNPDSWNDLGTAYFKLGDFENADENYLRAIKVAPDYYKGFYNLGYSKGKQKKYNEAEEYFKKALQIYDRDFKVWFALANAQMEGKKYDAALESLRQAMTIMPDNPEVKQAYDRLSKYIQDIKSGAITPPP